MRLLRSAHKSRSRPWEVPAGIIGTDGDGSAAPSSGNWRADYVCMAQEGRTRETRALGMTPNCAQASLRKTARPVRCKLGQAAYIIGVLPARLDCLGPRAQDWAWACRMPPCNPPG
jgi:hypothetical protein